METQKAQIGEEVAMVMENMRIVIPQQPKRLFSELFRGDDGLFVDSRIRDMPGYCQPGGGVTVLLRRTDTKSIRSLGPDAFGHLTLSHVSWCLSGPVDFEKQEMVCFPVTFVGKHMIARIVSIPSGHLKVFCHSSEEIYSSAQGVYIPSPTGIGYAFPEKSLLATPE